MICLHGKLRVEDLARRPSQLSSTELAERAESARTQLKTDPDCYLKTGPYRVPVLNTGVLERLCLPGLIRDGHGDRRHKQMSASGRFSER